MSETGRELLRLVLSVVVVDAAAIAVFLVADLADASTRARIVFGAVWTLVTLIVVLAGLARVRAARGGALRARAPR
jgi:hypothetical protein